MEDTTSGCTQIESIEDNPLSCSRCPNAFDDLRELEERVETQKEERPYKCEQCDRRYRHSGSLVNHRKMHQLGLFPCLICQKTFSNLLALKNHLRTHSEEKRFKCTDCNEGFRISRQLASHRWIAHGDAEHNCTLQNEEEEDISNGYDSPDPAPPLLMENGSLLSNLENYIAESMVPADFSQLDFKDYGESKHFDTTFILRKDDTVMSIEQLPTSTSDEERRFKCLQCGKAYKHAGSLANHRQSHTMGIYQCAVCFKEFSNLMAHKNHCRIHSDHKPYKCTHCDICFRLPTELRNHQKLHTEEKPYICSERFSNKKDVQKHELLHTQNLSEGENCCLRSSECSENVSSEEELTEMSTKPYDDQPQEIESKTGIPEGLTSQCSNELEEATNSTIIISDSQYIEDMNKLYKKDSYLCNDLQDPNCELPLLYIDRGDNFPVDEDLNNHACLDRKKDYVPLGHPNTASNSNVFTDSKEEPQINGDTELRPYKCQQCGRTYRHAGSLINHKKSHQTGVYSCSLCSKQLFNLAALKNHLRAHLKSKTKGGTDSHHYNSPDLLSESLKASEKPYDCCINGESFISENDLQQHESVHEDTVLSSSQDNLCLKNSSPGGLHGDCLEKSGEGSTETSSVNNQSLSASEIEGSRDNKEALIPSVKQEQVSPIQLEPEPSIKQELVPSIKQWCPDKDPNVSIKDLGLSKDVQNPMAGSCASKKESKYADSLFHQNGVDFQIQSKLEDHQNSSTEGDHTEHSGQESRPYKCNLCGRTYRHRGSLVNHKHTHQTGVYQCSICPKQYSNVMALRNHVRFHLRSSVGRTKPGDGSTSFQEVEKFYGCVFCSDTFEDPVDWHAHQMVHSSEKQLLEYQNGSELQESPERGLHRKPHGYRANENNTAENLEVYPETTKNNIKGDAECIDDMDTSENSYCDATEMPHMCRCCGQNFPDINSLQNHSRLHSSEGSSLPDKNTGNENICGSVGNSKPESDQILEQEKVAEISVQSRVSEHPEHFGKRMYECNICGKSYRHSGSLINHKRTHQTGDYCCDICAKQFNNLAALKNHLRIHLKAKRNSRLEDCDSSLLLIPESSPGLQSDTIFSCANCSDCFSSEVAFQSHQLVHTVKEFVGVEYSSIDHSKNFKDSVEDSNMQNQQDLCSSGAHQSSGDKSYGISMQEPRSPKEKDQLTVIKDRCLTEAVSVFKGKPDLEDDRYQFGEEKALQQIKKEGHNIDSVSCSPPDLSSSTNQTNTEGQPEQPPDHGSNEHPLYKCNLCGKSYGHADSLIIHKHSHLTGIYQCSFCPKEYDSLLALRSHFQTHTRSQMVRSVDRTPEDLQQLLNSQSEQLYDCSLCGMIFSEKVDFQQHQVSHDISHTSCDPEDGRSPQQSLKEEKNNESSAEDFAFHMHTAERELLERLEHEMESFSHGIDTDRSYSGGTHISHICGYCGKTYDDLESFKTHNLTHSDDHNISEVQSPHQPETSFVNIDLPSSHLADITDSDTQLEIFPKSSFLTEEPKNDEAPDSRPYACSQCGKTYRHGGSLVNHKKTHQVGDYQCGGCSRQYPNLAAYRNHLRHHPKCKLQVSLHDESRVSQHISAECAKSEGNCDISQCSTEKEGAQMHISCSNVQVHNSGESIKDCCETAASVAETSSNEDHSDERSSVDTKKQLSLPRQLLKDANVNMDYSSELDNSEELKDILKQKPLICDSCGELCDSATQLEDHKLLHCAGRSKDSMDGSDSAVNLGTEISESGLPTCIESSQTDYLKSDTQETKEDDFKHRPFKCELCNRTYRHAGSLINHKQTHKTGLFRCSVCQKWFYNLMALKNHNRIHFETKRYKCADCGKAFRLQKQLSTHQKMHNERATFSRKSLRQSKQPVRKARCSPNQEMQDLSGDEHAVTSKPRGPGLAGKVHSSSSNNRYVSHPKKQRNPDDRPYQCEQCGRSYRHASSLQNHKKSHTTGHYCCSICDKTYSNLMALKNHQRTHFEVKRYHCAECGKGFKWQRQLAKHQLFHAEKKSYFCGLCGKTLHGKLLFEKHQLEHEENKGGSMQDCTGDLTEGITDKVDFGSERTRVVKRHSSSSRKDNNAKSSHIIHSIKAGDCKHSCQNCRQVFNSYEELKSHQCSCCSNKELNTDAHLTHTSARSNQSSTDIHFSQRCEEGHTDNSNHQGVEIRPYQCNICGRTYRHAGSLLNHKNTHKTGLYKCSICLKQFYNPMAMKNHLRIHNAMKRFWCQDCGKAFRASRELISHQRVHTGERPFSCPVCSRGFSSKLSLKQHQKTHGNSKNSDQLSKVIESQKEDLPGRNSSPNDSMYEKISQDTYSADDPLSDDIVTPGDERPYKCNQCERTYRHAGSLLNHKKTHKTGVYQCPTCHKEFFNLLALKNHLRIHLDQNRYKCPDCGKAFRVSSRLASHRRIHTQGGPFPCSLCGKKFLRKSSFQRHQLLHSNQEVKSSLDTVESSGLANIQIEVT
uniref:Zinc finger protein 646-like n=1 Tax=Geotrypetes seraphini TaxID=260995 RepID=A0A6P8RDY2_GEOSA|nr:zinc finger protein 646-like [Geotrypetes seraphini]